MIGIQLGVFPSQPPNRMVTDPSGSFFAVMLLSVYASDGFLTKKPLASYTLIDLEDLANLICRLEDTPPE
jgi:hypothetical protein